MPMKSKSYGSRVACCARSESARRQPAREVGDRAAGPLVELSVDVVDEDVAAPPLLDGGLAVPEPQLSVVEFLQQRDVMAPRQLCNAALHNLPGPARLRRKPACTSGCATRIPRCREIVRAGRRLGGR